MISEAITPVPKNVHPSPCKKKQGRKCINGIIPGKDKTTRALLRMAGFLGLVLVTFTMSAQTVEMDRRTKEIPHSVLKVKDHDMEIHEILDMAHKFSSQDSTKFSEIDATYWVKLDFSDQIDTLGTQKSWRLRTINFSKATLYYAKKDTIGQKTFGQFEEHEERSSFVYTEGIAFEKNDLIDNRYLYLKVRLFGNYRKIPSFSYLSEESNRFFTKYYTNVDLYNTIVEHIFLGACLIFFLTFSIIFCYTKRPEFLYYALYVFFSAVFLVRLFMPGYFTFYDSSMGLWIVTISQILINLFYVKFAIYYLETRKNYPILHMIIRPIVVILIVLILAIACSHYFMMYSISNKILDIQRFLMTLFGVLSMIYLLIKAKDKLAFFIVTGSFIYMIGALAYLFTYFKYSMGMGIFLEIVVFSLGLAYKIKQEYEAKLVLQQEVSQKEINALRAQMNPHFIFNSMNSIQYLILKDDKLSALKYLSKFGKIARNVLESSHEATVTLTEEIELLRSYLELESLRFDNSFEYTVDIGKELDTDHVEIPLMLLQPFVENAIVHGLLDKKEDNKMLSLRFGRKDDFCFIEIEDNGVGRYASTSRNRTTKTHERSRGMQITEKRLNMLHTKNTMEIIDKYGPGGHPSGTKISIRIFNP